MSFCVMIKYRSFDFQKTNKLLCTEREAIVTHVVKTSLDIFVGVGVGWGGDL